MFTDNRSFIYTNDSNLRLRIPTLRTEHRVPVKRARPNRAPVGINRIILLARRRNASLFILFDESAPASSGLGTDTPPPSGFIIVL